VTDTALPLDRRFRPRSQVRTSSHAVDSLVEMDAMEDIHLLPGDTGQTRDWLPETSTTSQDTASHTLSHHATITSTELLHHAQTSHSSPHQPVRESVSRDTQPASLMTRTSERVPTLSLELKRSSKKSSPTDQSRVHSQSMRTSLPTSQESISTPLVLLSEDMPSRSLDGVKRMVLHTGSVLTHGTTNGVTMDSSRLSKETAESTTVWLLVSSDPTD